MNVTTHGSETTKDEILSVINLMDEEYRSFDLEVHVYGTFELAKEHLTKVLTGHCEQSVIESYLQEILARETQGSYLSSTDTRFTHLIVIYEFNLEQEGRKIQVASNLFHEYRHAFQNARLDAFTFNSTPDDSGSYKERPLEADANHFSISMMNLHVAKINDILKTHDTPWFTNPMPKNEMKAFKRTQELFPELFLKKASV